VSARCHPTKYSTSTSFGATKQVCEANPSASHRAASGLSLERPSACLFRSEWNNKKEFAVSITWASDRVLKTARAKASAPLADRWYSEKRLGGLSRFAFAITILNLVGHVFLGFEQSWLTPFVALAAAYGIELVGETIEARVNRRPTRYAGSFLSLVKFLLPA